jgi:ferredoxin, 2Fe-2S
MYTIKFGFEQEGLETVVLTNIESGYSLLEIALMNDIELNHECGGVCACSTCHLYVNKGREFMEELNNKEKDFIARAIDPRPNSRLGCQCLLNDGKGEIEVTLPEQREANS